jgi:outer membrane usher protein
LNYIRRGHYRDDEGERSPSESLAGIFASTSLGRYGFLQIYARRSSIGPGKTVFGSHLTMPFGGGRSGGASAEYRRGQKQLNLSMQKDLPVGQGLGYRTSVSLGESSRGEAALLMNTGVASLSLETAKTRDSSGIRLSAAGAVGMIGHTAFASRRLGDSFAAVKVDGIKGVRVYADNQLVGTTDSSGALVIPMMRAYERNNIRLDEADFPLDVQIEETEMAVRPFARAGTLIRFAARRERGALLQILLEDGGNLPGGARVFVEGGKVGHVAVSGGEVYIPDLVGRGRLTASWSGRACTVSVEVPGGDDPQPRIAGLVCKAVAVLAAR